MDNRKPKNPFHPNENTEDIKRKIRRQNELYRPQPQEKVEEELDKDLKTLEKLNRRISLFLKPKSINITDDEKKKKIGLIIITLILLVLIISSYYFLIYGPSQQELEEVKNDKLNQLHSLYKGPLASASESFTLEQKIKDCKSVGEVNAINLIGIATKDWKNFQKKSINENHDEFNRTMAVYENNESIIMSIDEAMKIVNNNGVNILSNIQFEKPDTISVPILISRLQAGAGLVSVGSIVDIYTQKNVNGTVNIDNGTIPNLSGCTVLSIMRCEESGEIESDYGKSKTIVNSETTQPLENTETFTANIIEMIKGSLAGGYNEKQTLAMLNHYGIKLANCEREINLAELDAQYLLLLEIPHNKVNYVINNMDNIILTIPTKNAPNWMVNEITSTYK